MKKISLLSLIAALMIFTNCGKDDSVTINPVDLNFADSDLTVDESAGTQTITISLGDVAPIEGTFTITLGGTATYGDDYTTTPAAEDGVVTVTVSEGDESKELTVTIVDDSDLELDETITMTIASDIEALELGSDASATVTLTSNDQALVAVERSSGKMYMVNLEDGSKTDLLTITGVEGSGEPADLKMEESSANIRSFDYDETTGMGFIGQNNQGGSKIYSVNMSSGAASVLFENDEEDYGLSGVTDMQVLDGVVYGASRYYDDIEEESAFGYFEVNKTSGALSNFESIVDNPEYIGGGAFLLTDEFAYMTALGYGEGSSLLAMDLSDSEITTTSWTATNASAFSNAVDNFDIEYATVMNFAVSSKGTVYAVVFFEGGEGPKISIEEGSPTWMLVKVDLEEVKLKYLSTLSEESSTEVSAIGFLPDEVVLPLLSE